MGASAAQAQAIRLEVGRTSSGVRWLLPRPEDPRPGQVLGGASNTDRRSFYLAGRARLDATPWLGLETGLGLVPKGFEVTGPTFHMLYLEVPLVAVLQTEPTGGFFAEVGVSLAYRARCRRFFRTSGGLHEDGCGAETVGALELDPLRAVDVSWTLGGGVRLHAGPGAFVATARVLTSLIDIQPAESGDKMINRVQLIGLAYEWRPLAR